MLQFILFSLLCLSQEITPETHPRPKKSVSFSNIITRVNVKIGTEPKYIETRDFLRYGNPVEPLTLVTLRAAILESLSNIDFLSKNETAIITTTTLARIFFVNDTNFDVEIYQSIFEKLQEVYLTLKSIHGLQREIARLRNINIEHKAIKTIDDPDLKIFFNDCKYDIQAQMAPYIGRMEEHIKFLIQEQDSKKLEHNHALKCLDDYLLGFDLPLALRSQEPDPLSTTPPADQQATETP